MRPLQLGQAGMRACLGFWAGSVWEGSYVCAHSGAPPGAEPKAQGPPEGATHLGPTEAMLPWIGLKEMPSGRLIPLIFEPGGAGGLDYGLPAALQQPPLAFGAPLRHSERGRVVEKGWGGPTRQGVGC